MISVLVSGSTKYTCGSEKKVVMRGIGIFLVLLLMLSTLVFFSVTCSTFPDLSTVQTVERETPVASVFTVLFQPCPKLIAYRLGNTITVRTAITSHGAAQEDNINKTF